MAVQALMDPKPMQLLAKVAPAPSDVVWQNTYLPRSIRMFRAWTITLFIAVLTVFWALILVPIAGLLSLENIGKVSPQLRDALNSHQISRALVQTGIPTALFSGLAVAVPYLYYCKSFPLFSTFHLLTNTPKGFQRSKAWSPKAKSNAPS